MNWALLAFDAGDAKLSISLARHCLRLRAIFRDRVEVAACLELLAWIAAGDADYGRAARLMGLPEPRGRGSAPTCSLT